MSRRASLLVLSLPYLAIALAAPPAAAHGDAPAALDVVREGYDSPELLVTNIGLAVLGA